MTETRTDSLPDPANPTVATGVEPTLGKLVVSGTGTANLHRATNDTSAGDGEDRRALRESLLQHWECVVQSIGPETFVATLRSLRDPMAPELDAEIPVDDVSPDDIELLAEGAIFYWAIGYATSASGTRRRMSQITFRRLPAWTKKDIARVRDTGRELFEMFGAVNDTSRQAAG